MPTPCPLSVIYRPTDLGDRSTIPGVEARVSGEVLSLRSVTVEAGVNRHWSSNHRSREENEGGSETVGWITCCERTAPICWEEFELFPCHLKGSEGQWDVLRDPGAFIYLF